MGRDNQVSIRTLFSGWIGKSSSRGVGSRNAVVARPAGGATGAPMSPAADARRRAFFTFDVDSRTRPAKLASAR